MSPLSSLPSNLIQRLSVHQALSRKVYNGEDSTYSFFCPQTNSSILGHVRLFILSAGTVYLNLISNLDNVLPLIE